MRQVVSGAVPNKSSIRMVVGDFFDGSTWKKMLQFVDRVVENEESLPETYDFIFD